jgi:fatty acid desaturase
MMSVEKKINWYRTELDKETLKQLTQRCDRQGFLRIISLLAMVICTGAIAYYAFLHWPWWAVIAACYLHGTLFQFVGISGPGHELSHYTVFKTRALNSFFSRLTGFITWNDYFSFRLSHNKHHQLTVHKGLDGEVVLPQKITMLDWFYFFTFDFRKLYQSIKGLVMLSAGIIKGDWAETIMPKFMTKERRKVFGWARVLLVGHIILAGIFLYTGQWFLIVIFTLAPFYAQWLNILCASTQHAGMQPDVSDYRLCCRTVILNPFLAFLYCNMNYHVEHHMYAAVPFYNLPKLRKAIEHDIPAASPSLWAAWREIIPAMRKQKTDPEYYIPVILPASARAAERKDD